VSSAAQRLYSNTDGALDQFEAFWSRVAGIFVNRSTVVGYGIVNEPWLGDMYTNPALLLPGESDKANLQPMYAAVAQAIRKVDSTTPIWFEPATGGNILDALPVGFDAIPDPNSVMGYHIYCPMLQSDLPHPSKANQTNLWDDLELCLALNGAQLDIRGSDTAKLGVPGVLTEFGSVSQMNQTEALLRWTVEQAEQRLLPWVYWLLTPSTDAQQPNWEDPILRRPYVQSLPGRLNATSWNETTGVLRVRFTANCTSEAAAETSDLSTMTVFTPTQAFGSNFTVSSAPSGAVTLRQFNTTTGFSQLSIAASLPPSSTVTVTIQAA
jgi:endoglycosylceramidase